MRRCCVCGCYASTSEEIRKLHRFPRNDEMSELWAQSIGLEYITNKTVEDRYNKLVVCSHHFELKMYPHQIMSHRLKASAFPTLHLSNGPIRTYQKIKMTNEPKPSTSQNVSFDEQLLYPEIIYSDEPIPFTSKDPLCPISETTQTPASFTVHALRKGEFKQECKNCQKQLAVVGRQEERPPLSVTEEGFLNFIDLHFDKKVGTFIKRQYSLSQNRKREDRYSKDFKRFALTLYFSSPEVYKFLQTTFKLPAKSTLLRFTSAWDLSPDLNDFLFQVVKSKLQ